MTATSAGSRSRSARPAARVEIMVRDSGPGVATTIATEVFEHGFTTKAPRTANGASGLP